MWVCVLVGGEEKGKETAAFCHLQWRHWPSCPGTGRFGGVVHALPLTANVTVSKGRTEVNYAMLVCSQDELHSPHLVINRTLSVYNSCPHQALFRELYNRFADLDLTDQLSSSNNCVQLDWSEVTNIFVFWIVPSFFQFLRWPAVCDNQEPLKTALLREILQ